MTLGGIRCHWIISQTAHLEGVCMRELSSLANSHRQLPLGAGHLSVFPNPTITFQSLLDFWRRNQLRNLRAQCTVKT